jgi:hypothetical protein
VFPGDNLAYPLHGLAFVAGRDHDDADRNSVDGVRPQELGQHPEALPQVHDGGQVGPADEDDEPGSQQERQRGRAGLAAGVRLEYGTGLAGSALLAYDTQPAEVGDHVDAADRAEAGAEVTPGGSHRLGLFRRAHPGEDVKPTSQRLDVVEHLVRVQSVAPAGSKGDQAALRVEPPAVVPRHPQCHVAADRVAVGEQDWPGPQRGGDQGKSRHPW